MSARSPVGRLAPSPTGFLHLGHARSFLLAWWSARSRGGRMVLRIEDLDRARVRPEFLTACLQDLAWLGLDWDEGPHCQSADPAPYERACAELLASGHAYPCVCSRAEITAASAPHAEDAEVRYPGTCRGRWSDLAAAEADSGRPAGLRLAIPPGPIEISDVLHGACSFDVQAEVGDLLLKRRDGVPSYQLAVVVDDARQGVTEVLRGSDLLSSAARQAWIQRYLGLPHPTWVHVPLVAHADGRRLAKRQRDTSLAELRAGGVDGRAVVAWAARTVGLECPVPCEPAQVTARFDTGRIPLAPVLLDPQSPAGLRPGAP